VSTYYPNGMYRRTVAAIPQFKQLVKVDGLDDWPRLPGQGLGKLCPDVVFQTLVDDHGSRFWSKKWLNQRAALEPVTFKIEQALANLAQCRLSLAVERSEVFGLIYPYSSALFSAVAVVHQWDLHWYFTEEQTTSIREIASHVVEWPGLPVVSVGELTDFQAVRDGQSLICLDFEPSAHYAWKLAGVSIP
jgi:hypothetical protein